MAMPPEDQGRGPDEAPRDVLAEQGHGGQGRQDGHHQLQQRSPECGEGGQREVPERVADAGRDGARRPWRAARPVQ